MQSTTNNNLPAAGTRVISVSGMGGNVKIGGMVLCHNTDRWSTHAVVLMDNGTTRRCEGLARRGVIGWHVA